MKETLPVAAPQRGRRLLTLAVLALTFTFLGLSLRNQWARLAQHSWQIQPALLALSFLLAQSWFLLRACIWQLACPIW